MLSAYGRPLAISAAGEWYGSNHHVNYNRVTKSKNTILVNGNGRAFGDGSGAAISEFFTGAYFTMATGTPPRRIFLELNQFDRRVLSLGGTLSDSG